MTKEVTSDNWESLDQPEDNLEHTEAEYDWLGFETQHVINETRAIRSQWDEDEHRRRASVPVGAVFQLLLSSGLYDPHADSHPLSSCLGDKEVALPTQSSRVHFGSSILGARYDGSVKKTNQGAGAADSLKQPRPIR